MPGVVGDYPRIACCTSMPRRYSTLLKVGPVQRCDTKTILAQYRIPNMRISAFLLHDSHCMPLSATSGHCKLVKEDLIQARRSKVVQSCIAFSLTGVKISL